MVAISINFADFEHSYLQTFEIVSANFKSFGH